MKVVLVPVAVAFVYVIVAIKGVFRPHSSFFETRDRSFHHLTKTYYYEESNIEGQISDEFKAHFLFR